MATPLTPEDLKIQENLIHQLGQFKYDPLGFVMTAFPWGEKGTPLEHYPDGPRKWQKRVLKKLGEHLRAQQRNIDTKQDVTPLQLAVASGRGIGKSALYGMLSTFTLSCWWGATVIITANTENQLLTRTWPEVMKWYRMSINSGWFTATATKISPNTWFKDALEKQMRLDTSYYYAQVQNWSEENPDAFAGVHNMNGLVLLMDEASGIPTKIWDVSKGFFTEPTVLQAHIAFSNPRRTDGAFFECFNKNRAYWDTEHIDSRTVEGTNPTIYQQIVDQYGEDSDPARVEVRGLFPEQAEDKFFSMADVRRAVDREPDEDHDEQFPIIMGIDVAGPGKDYTVVAFRQGRNAKILPWSYWKGVATDQSVAKIARLIDKYQPDAVFMDADGMGGPMVDNLRNTLRYRIITPVRSGPPSTDPFYYDERTRCYAHLKDWLKMASIPSLERLKDDLSNPRVEYYGPDQKIKLESKKDMRARGLASTDFSDPLAYTFYKPVSVRTAADVRSAYGKQSLPRMPDIGYSVLD